MDEILQQPEQVEVVDIQFRPGQKIYFFDPAGEKLSAGDHVIIDTARGPEYGICAGGNHSISAKDIVSPLRPVLRRANAQDEKQVEDNRAREKKAYEVCLQKIAEHGLDMQLVSAECAFDGSKILFFFTADERVDFRELVKNLAGVFHTRIELRQIGVRDKAKMVGGLGICGRPFCCASFLDDFQPVSIKMAKTQNLSLNPTKISGTCGRLMCCLKYEQDAYEDLLRRTPHAESFVDTPEGRGTVTEVSLLRQKLKVQMEDSPETISVFSVDEVAVYRNGKAKKNDAPIPADWAPISGSGKVVRKKEPEFDSKFLDPIKFRYRDESVVDEQPEEAPQEAAPAVAAGGNSRRRRRHNRSEQLRQADQKQEAAAEQPKKEKKPQPKPEAKPEAPKQEAGAEEKPKQNHHRRRPNHHRRKPKPQGGAE